MQRQADAGDCTVRLTPMTFQTDGDGNIFYGADIADTPETDGISGNTPHRLCVDRR